MNLIKQPTYNSCTSACLAMLTGLPLDQVMDEFHEKWVNGDDVPTCQFNPYTYLCSKGFMPQLNCNPYGATLLGNAASLLTVPSLNLEAINHHLIYDCTDMENPQVLDPSTKKTYDIDSLRSWQIDLFLLSGDVGRLA